MISGEASTQPLAPWWHTVLVLVPVVALSVASWYQHGLANAHISGLDRRVSGYLTVLLVEWLQVLLIYLALKRGGLSLNSLVSGRWQTLRSFLRDLGISIGFLVVVVPLIGLLVHILGAGINISHADITPKNVFQLVVWLVLTTTCGGFCEEIIFRGYLTQQFSAWTGSVRLAIFLQGVIFGLGHGFYGTAMFAIMVHGWLLGMLAYWRKSLLPGMLAHGLQDSIGGIIAFFTGG
jgi:uncharacterized protein